MNLKEFNAKQFLLEKGERVGLGIAVTLMVLMLIFSLFMPSQGFFSGSPADKAKPLVEGTKKLGDALKNPNAKPGPEDSPPAKNERHLIDLDTVALQPQLYEMGAWYEPTAPVNPARRPPGIKNITEAVMRVIHIDIDTYLFDKNFTRVQVLVDREKKSQANSNAGGRNPNAMMRRMYSPGNAPMSGQSGKFKGVSGRGVVESEERPVYEVSGVPLEKLDGSEHLARQLQPLRMNIIAASFPYKEQVEEFKTQLRLPTLQAVLDEDVDDIGKDSKDKVAAFRFLGVEVQRKEFDAKGKALGDWKDLDLHADYKTWLMHCGLPFEPDDPKYSRVTFDKLVWPRLREFHEEKPQEQMGMRAPGAPGPQAAMPKEAPAREGESKYPDVAGELPSLQKTLAALADVKTEQIAVVPAKFQKNIDIFNPLNAAPVPEAVGERKTDAATDQGTTVPDFCLVRLIDVTVEPGRFYRYRVKLRMANPNYKRSDVASPTYKDAPELKSPNWFELPQTVSVPPELIYYVVDQKMQEEQKLKKEGGPRKPVKLARDTPRYQMWNRTLDPDRQVAFQFHRWIESTPVTAEGAPIPIGEWTIADRVLVARGEYIGQKVKVDLPVWKYTLDSFVLPTEDQHAKRVRGKLPSGVTVDFGQDPDNETILVDFEGGKQSIRGAMKVDDTSGIEVLMLSPDGKLRARNGGADADDKKREERRSKVLNRIEEVRTGKGDGANPGGGGLLDGGR